MNRLTALTLLLVLASSAARGDEPKWESLFDGKTLEGWEGDLKTFRIEDGAITAGNMKDKVPRNEFLTHKREFADFELKLTFKLLGKGSNAGIQIRSRRIPNHHEMIGYQADMGQGWWGCLYDESRRRKVLAKAPPELVKVLKADDWNEYLIRCEGKRVRLWINGLATVDYTETDDKIEQKGLIGLQIHGGPPSQVWYKDIQVRVPPGSEPKPSSQPAGEKTTYRRDLTVPPLSEGEPAAGKRVRQSLPPWRGTGVYHSLYLPGDWQKGKSYPVIAEYAGNQGGIGGEGKYDACLGYGQSGGKGFIWMCLPYINSKDKAYQLQWWGDVEATLDYARRAIRDVCERWGGDGSAVLLTGFSRGSIACGYLGLHDDRMADIWLAFMAHSHFDGGPWPIGDKAAARRRLARLKGRSMFVTNEGAEIFKPVREHLAGCQGPITLLPLPHIKHENTWVLHDCPQRGALRAWLADVLQRKPGTHCVSGRVTDTGGSGLAGVRIEGGYTHWTFTGPDGRYRLGGLIDGRRTLKASMPGRTFEPALREVDLAGSDTGDQDFAAKG